MERIKKHKSHLTGKRARHRPFGKFNKILKKEEINWLRNADELDKMEAREKLIRRRHG